MTCTGTIGGFLSLGYSSAAHVTVTLLSHQSMLTSRYWAPIGACFQTQIYWRLMVIILVAVIIYEQLLDARINKKEIFFVKVSPGALTLRTSRLAFPGR